VGVEVVVFIDWNILEAAIQSRTIVAVHWLAPVLGRWEW
jgi:hypothetical protein